MAFDSFSIELEGEEATDLYDDLVSLEVELCDDLPASFRLVVGTAPQADGSWKYLDEERLRVWTPVTVTVGFVDSGREELFQGYITQVRNSFEPDEDQCTIEVTGLDGSVLMDREEKLKSWPNKKDSDIVAEIFGLYGFAPQVEDTTVVHDEAVSTVIQRETDLQFLKRLALRNGFACYVDGERGFFRPMPAEEEPQPILSVHFGEETNMARFTVSVDALRPAAVQMFQVGRLGKEVISALVEASEREALGEIDAAGLLTGEVEAGRVFVGKNAATGTPEMEALCRGLFDEGAWFVSGEGEVDAGAYEHVLKPRGLVTIKGVGETHSGVYYVSYVRHVLTCESYTQHFRVKRDALRPSGDESFSGNGALGGLL